MSNSRKVLTVAVLAMLVVFQLTGCGTVKKVDDDSSGTEAATKAPKTFIDTSKVRVTTSYVSGLNDTVSPNAIVEVYCGQPFTAATLVGSDVAPADEFGNGGSFAVDISGCSFETFYVVATAQGHSMSDPVAVQKP